MGDHEAPGPSRRESARIAPDEAQRNPGTTPQNPVRPVGRGVNFASAAQDHAIPHLELKPSARTVSSLPQRNSARFAENYLPPEHNGNSFERAKRSNAEGSQAPTGERRLPASNPDTPTRKKKIVFLAVKLWSYI